MSRKTSTDIFTQGTFFGIGDDGNWYYPLNQPIQFPIIGLDKNEKELNDVSAKVEVIRHEYKTVLTKGLRVRYKVERFLLQGG